MNYVAVTLRSVNGGQYNEHRDAIDRRWYAFLKCCGLTPLLLPNDLALAKNIISLDMIKLFLISGGDDLVAYGGNDQEREEVELYCIAHGINKKIPVLGICRGMQLIQCFYGVKLIRIKGHVRPKLNINLFGKIEEVNSFHNWGTYSTDQDLEIIARAEDGVVKAIKHRIHPVQGIMWHPERFEIFRDQDVRLVRTLCQLEH